METISILLIVSILHLYLPLLEGADEVIVRVCPSRKVDWDAAARRKECNTKGGDYHCIRNQDGKLVESCVPKVWIDPGDCPILYQNVGRFGYEQCHTVTGFPCPNLRYLSNTVYLYPVCFEKPEVTTQSAKSTVLTSSATSNFAGNVNKNDANTERALIWKPIASSVAGFLVGILFLFIVLCLCLRRRTKQRNWKGDVEESVDLLQRSAVQITGPIGAVKAGKSCIIKCSFTNLTAKEIKWRKNNEDIDISDKNKYKGGTCSNPSLTILNMSMKDNGTYQCICSDANQRNVESNTIKIEVNDLPQVYIIPPLNAAKGDDITIHCVVRASPTITSLKWGKDGVLLDTVDKNKYDGGNSDEPSLTIKNISPDDAGTYWCLGTNSKGTGKSEPVTVNVLDYIHSFEPIVSKTEAIEKAKKKIMKEGMVVLVGDFGAGKTTALEQLYHHVFAEAPTEQIWKVELENYDFEKDMKDTENGIISERLIICLDDCCGKYNTNPFHLKSVQTTLLGLRNFAKREPGWRKVIATLTSAEFSLLSSLKGDTQLPQIDDVVVHCDISEAEKLEILGDCTNNCNCENCSKVPWKEVMQEIIEERFLSTLQSLSWPLICRLVSIPYIARNVGSFIDKPLLTLSKGIEELREMNIAAYSGLVYMMLKGGTLNVRSIDIKCLRFILVLHSALPDHDEDLAYSTKLVTQQLKTVPEYVKFDCEKFTIFHEIISLALFCCFYTKYPKETIHYCDLQFIADLFLPENYDASDVNHSKPLIEMFLLELGNRKKETQKAIETDEKGSESAPSFTQVTGIEKNIPQGSRTSSSAVQIKSNQNMDYMAKRNTKVEGKHFSRLDNQDTDSVTKKGAEALEENLNESTPPDTQSQETKRNVLEEMQVSNSTEQTRDQQNIHSVSTENIADNSKHISVSKNHGQAVNPSSEENIPHDKLGSTSAEQTSGQQSIKSHEDRGNHFSESGNPDAVAKTVGEMSTIVTNESSKMVEWTGDNEDKKQMKKSEKPKYYFTYNQEDREIILKRAVEEMKLELFKGHPLMQKGSFDHIN